jgi:hypothetical protein
MLLVALSIALLLTSINSLHHSGSRHESLWVAKTVNIGCYDCVLLLVIIRVVILVQVIPNLPRLSLRGQRISNDVSDYIKFRCEGIGKRRSCTIDQSQIQLSSRKLVYGTAMTSTESDDDGDAQIYVTVS